MLDPVRISLGAAALNLAAADDPHAGLPIGTYLLLVGDSSAGKTWLSHTLLAEAAGRKDLAKYALVYDNVEDGAMFNVARYFGERAARRITPPASDSDGPKYSETVEEFYANVKAAISRGPTIYVLDSMDGLTTEAELKKAKQQAAARRTGAAVAGSFGDGKARTNSQELRRLRRRLEQTDSVLVIICQTRDDLGSPYGGKTRAGGRALRFYAAMEVWLSVAGKERKEINGKKRTVLWRIRADLKKNRVTGGDLTVEFPILYEYGIDDVNWCLDYLISTGAIAVSGRTLAADDLLGVSGTREKVIRHVEGHRLFRTLRTAAGRAWVAERASLAPRRRPKFEE